ncbi:MBL fold metallo-hydrolase [Candidatus Woesearchaeota archaeon]|nr:MBL fold metallo-hydrolase [Candidatus Woesearchaeota archaeon]
MKVKVLGSGREVGRSAIVLEGKKDGKRVMMDCGVKIEPPPPQYPMNEKTDAIILSHAHLDHSGAVPMMLRKSSPHVFMNDITLELSAMLIRDSIKVGSSEGYPTPFTEKDLKKMVKHTKITNYGNRFSVGDTRFSFWRSGHIPGSSSVLAENGKKLFYTSDIQTIDSNLLNKCNLPEKADVVIIESTYGQKNHPPRKQIEHELVQTVEEAISRNEVVLMPVFAVGRAQEIMMILEKYADKIVVDGMARLASYIISDHPSYLRDPKRFKAVLDKVKIVKNWKDRKKAIEKYPIILSSAGMLGGGPAVSYLREISRRKESKVVFSGFLVEESPGRNLIKTKIFKNAEEEFDVHCDLHQFELSAHTDRKGIFSVIERLKPETVICVHGEHCERLAKDVAEEFNIQAYAPKNGEEVKI